MKIYLIAVHKIFDMPIPKVSTMRQLNINQPSVLLILLEPFIRDYTVISNTRNINLNMDCLINQILASQIFVKKIQTGCHDVHSECYTSTTYIYRKCMIVTI